MAEPQQHCGHCGDRPEEIWACMSCNIMQYCSKACLKADRRWHKRLCTQFHKFQEKPQSDVELRRAILLPDGESDDIMRGEDAEIIGDFGVKLMENGDGYSLPIESQIPGFDNGGPEYAGLVCGTAGGGELLDHTLQVLVRNCSGNRPRNQCVADLLCEEVARKSHGPVVFLRMTKVEESTHTLDIDSTDFTLALDGLIDLAIRQGNYFSAVQKVTGVKASTNAPCYEEIEVPRSHKIFRSRRGPSYISQHIGLPLRTTMYRTKATTTSTPTPEVRFPVLPAAYLYISLDIDSPDFGSIPAAIRDCTQSVLIVSDNGAAITTSAIPTICDFIEDEVQPMLAGVSTASRQARQDAVDSIAGMWQQRWKDEGKPVLAEPADDDYVRHHELFDMLADL